MKKTEFTYSGEKRPLIHIPNFPDIYLNNGDKLWIISNRVYKEGVFDYSDNAGYHRNMCTLSNFFPYTLGSVEKLIPLFKEILEGKRETPLEYYQERYKSFEDLVPKGDFIAAHYQFSNSVRPTCKFTFENGLYSGGGISKYTLEQTSRYLCSNLYVILPEGVKEVNASEYEKLSAWQHPREEFIFLK